MPRKGGKRKKSRTHLGQSESIADDVPKSFVFKRGKVPAVVSELVADLRHVMEPFTARNLKERKSNSIKDFIKVAAPLGISHFAFFSSTKINTNLKITRLPRGPTLSFQLNDFALMRHIRATQKRPIDASLAFQTSPLVVLNNFNSNEDHVKLMNITFQNMFPAIDVQTVKLSNCRRVVLFNYDKENDVVEFRQFAIRANPLGLSRTVKQLVKARIPNLSKSEDISDLVYGAGMTGATSESEVDDESTHVTLPDHFQGRGNKRAQQSAIRLNEIGPRMTLKLVKVEREICEGDVLYHAFVSKSTEDAARDKAKRETAVALKKHRREEQEENVQKKKDEQENKLTTRRERKADREQAKQGKKDVDSDSEDEATYYRREVGDEPAANLFSKKQKKKQSSEGAPNLFNKKQKVSNE